MSGSVSFQNFGSFAAFGGNAGVGQGTAFTLPFNIFVPTEWSNAGQTAGAPGGNAITPGLLAAQQASLQQTINNSIASAFNFGGFLTSGVATALNTWAGSLGQVDLLSAQTAQLAVNKSAKGCSGFLSCFFG